MASTLKRAKTLDDDQLSKLSTYVQNFSRMPARDMLMLMLSFKAGLRAAEIAKIDMNALTDAEGNIGKHIVVTAKIAKGGKRNRNIPDREIPMHPLLAKAIRAFRRDYPTVNYVAISARGARRQMSPNAVAQYLKRLYHNAGFQDCSSHSGRRTFGTKAARLCNQHNRSLRDVQRLLGHARLDTTERYIDVAAESFNLVAAL